MCPPVIAAGLQIAGSVASFAGQQQQTDAYNAAAAQNAVNASVGATGKYVDEGRKYIYSQRQNQQEGFQAVVKGRQAGSTGVASAGASGIDMSSLSVGDILSAEAQKTAQNMDNIRTKQDDRRNSYNSNVATYEAEAQGRINSMPFKPDPSPLGMMINIASSGFSGYKGMQTA